MRLRLRIPEVADQVTIIIFQFEAFVYAVYVNLDKDQKINFYSFIPENAKFRIIQVPGLWGINLNTKSQIP